MNKPISCLRAAALVCLLFASGARSESVLEEVKRLDGEGANAPAAVDSPEKPLIPGADDFFDVPKYADLAFSPDGALFATVVNLDDGPAVRVYDLDLLKGFEMKYSWLELPHPAALIWVGPRRLAVIMRVRGHERNVMVVDIQHMPGNKPYLESYFWIPRKGVIVDPLPLDPDHVLLLTSTSIDTPRSEFRQGVWKVRFGDKSKDRFSYKRRLAAELPETPKIVTWFPDGKGDIGSVLVAHMRAPEDDDDENEERLDSVQIMHRKGGTWVAGLRVSQDDHRTVLGATPDARNIYLVDEERERRDTLFVRRAGEEEEQRLLKVDGLISKLLHAADSFKPIGVSYLRDGLVHFVYFDPVAQAREREFSDLVPGQKVMISAIDPAGRRVMAFEHAPDAAPRLLTIELDKKRVRHFGDVFPRLAGFQMGRTERILVDSPDGHAIESFLTMPPGEHKAWPLIVMPHGGPFGIREYMGFDSTTQFLATHGFAVVRTNFRGSGGSGTEFVEAGKREQGKGIEDDINLVVDHLLRSRPLDPGRICAAGSSYGGYSSLMLMIRWPQRYRCAASHAGVTDLRLLFFASDAADDELASEWLREWYGDPDADAARFRENSPVYRYRELKGPVLLAHGVLDARVDVDHSRRLAALLTRAGRAPRLKWFPEVGHSFGNVATTIEYHEELLDFIQSALRATDDSSRLGKSSH